MYKVVFILVCTIFCDSFEFKTNTSLFPIIEASNWNYIFSVIIIGAGPAGIAAATKLLKNNFTNIKILEAENRIGGRVNSVKYGDVYVDLGAQFCHGEEENIVYNMVKDLNILKHSEGDLKLYLSNGEIVDQDVQQKLMNFVHNIDASKENKETELLCQRSSSIGDCFDIKYLYLLNNTVDLREKVVLKDAKKWLNNYLCHFDATFDLNDLKRKSSYKKCKGDLYMNWNGRGYKTILEVMMGKFPNGTSTPLPLDEKILLGKEVIAIRNWNEGNPITVVTKEGEIFAADHVVFTPSVGVLKAEYKNLFEPSLPDDKINAIKGIGFGATVKIILKFSEPLPNISKNVGTIWLKKHLNEANQKGFGWLCHLSKIVLDANNPKILTGWYAGDNVTEVEKLSDEEIMNGQKFIVEKFLKVNNVPEPEGFIRSSWFSNPHFRGTYSYESVEGHSKYGGHFQETLSAPLANKDRKPTLLFAGEATHLYYFSTVHGAIETGYKQAQNLINFFLTIKR